MIHFLNPLWDAMGGSECRTLQLYELLSSRTDVLLWSEYRVDPRIAARVPVETIDVPSGHFPRGGTLVVVGAYFTPRGWIRDARPRRVVLIYNTFTVTGLAGMLDLLEEATDLPVEIVYASESLREKTGLDGLVQLSPISAKLFQPAPARTPGGAFTVGRLSRDIPQKHHPEDPALYRRLAEAGCRIRIMGGTCLPETPGVERLPAGAEPAPEFLQSLDAFVFRTAPEWYETFGRVVFEAMACAVPVVVHRRGGYTSHLEHGRSALLFDTQAEALAHLLTLQADPERRQIIGETGREAFLSMYSPAWEADLVAFYLR